MGQWLHPRIQQFQGQRSSGSWKEEECLLRLCCDAIGIGGLPLTSTSTKRPSIDSTWIHHISSFCSSRLCCMCIYSIVCSGLISSCLPASFYFLLFLILICWAPSIHSFLALTQGRLRDLRTCGPLQVPDPATAATQFLPGAATTKWDIPPDSRPSLCHRQEI